MTTPRCILVDPDQPLFYHLISRCVRRAWLCGFDRLTHKDFSHRKEWLLQRLRHIGQSFAVDVYAYAVMSNHFHLVVYYDPNAAGQWSDAEVADRWLHLCPPKLPDGTVDETLLSLQREIILSQTERIDALRTKLGSLSVFMKFLKQPIARRANLEDDCTGHFFEQRFHSIPLLSDETAKIAMSYVDLNPVRAKIAKSIEESKHTSIYERFQKIDHQEALDTYLAPLVSGLKKGKPLPLTLASYAEHFNVLLPTYAASTTPWPEEKVLRWRTQVAMLSRRQRVHGPRDLVEAWIKKRGWQLRESLLPA